MRHNADCHARVITHLWPSPQYSRFWPPSGSSGRESLYYIAADEVVWDYAPSYPDNPIMGEPFGSEESVYLKQGDDRIGRRYLKAVYREYTDGSFSTLKDALFRGELPRHLGADSACRGRRHDRRAFS
jgi:hypothetical protein